MALPGSTIEADDVAGRISELQGVIDRQRRRARQHLQLAARVHGSLLPSPVHSDRIDVDVRYLPVDEVGGDYCQVRFSSEDVCYVTVCDVTGHGIGAALLATRVSSEVRHAVLSGQSPAEVLDALNTFVCADFADAGLFLTFFALRIDLAARRITWSGAGHPSPILLRGDDSTALPLVSQNLMIGVRGECLAAEPEHRLPIAAGDRILLYTDGVTEIFDGTGSELGQDGLVRLLRNAGSDDVFGMTDRLLEQIGRFQPGPATDDRTLILAGIK